MSFRLNDFKNFIECAGSPTFSEAARKLGITQPALSESMRRLEADVGGVLFFRSKSGISLTPAGRKTLESTKALLGILSEMPAQKSRTPPLVIVGCHSVVASYVLPVALRELNRLEPHHRVALEHGTSREIQEKIQRGVVDVGVVVNAISNPDLVVKKLESDRVCVWAHTSGALREQVICDPQMLQTQAIMRRWKNRPPAMLTTTNLELMVRLVDARLGYGVIPKRAVDLLGKSLQPVRGTPEYADEISLIYRPEFGKTSYEKTILRALEHGLL